MPLDPSLDPLFEQAAQQYNIDPALLKALALTESSGNPKAVNKKSGASGLMQFTPDTAQQYGVQDPTDPQQAIPAAAHYLSDLLTKHEQAGGDTLTRALDDYSGGGGKGYVGKVSNYYQDLQSAPPPAVVTAPPAAAASQPQDHPTDALSDVELIAAYTGGKPASAAVKTAPVGNTSFAERVGAIPAGSAAQIVGQPTQEHPIDAVPDDALIAAFATPKTAAKTTTPTADELIAKAKSQGSYVPPPAEAQQMAGDLAAVVARSTPPAPSTASQVGAGLTRGAIMDPLRSVVDPIANYLEDKLGTSGLEKRLGFPTAQEASASHTTADQALAQQQGNGLAGTLGRIGGNLIVAVPATEAALAGGGALLGAGARVAGQALPDLAKAGQTIATDLGPLATGARLATRGAAAGAVGGLVNSAASDEPLWQQATQNALLGGGIGVAAPILMRGGANALTGIRNNIITPLAATVSQGARETGAARNLLTQSSDPTAVYNRLTGPAANDLVPGSPATTFQVTGDPGLGQVERGVSRVYPEPFKAVEGQQNAARVAAVRGAAPDMADPMAVRDTVQQHLARLDQEGEANIAAARQNADQAMAIAGGNLPRDAQGALMREQLEAAKATTKANESRLWQAIDPDGSLTIGTSPTSKAAAKIANDIPQTAKPPEGEEAAIFSLAKDLPSTAPFQDFAALRGRLMQAIRDERVNGQTPALRRMQMLRESMDHTMSQGVADVANEQASAVAAGAMSPEETVLSKLVSQVQGHFDERNAAAPVAFRRLAAGTISGEGPGNVSGASNGVGGVSAGGGGQGQARGGLVNPPGNPGVQSAASVEPPTFDPEAAARYRAAAEATRSRAQTFNTGATGQTLQSGPSGTPYRVTDTNVPEKFISSPEGMQSFLQAGGQPETLRDAIVGDLRATASRPDGTIDPRKLTAWQTKRADALRAFPDLRQRLGDIGTAQETVDNAMATHAANLADYQKSAVAPFLANEDPAKAVARVFAGDGVGKMRELVSRIGSNPDAVDGLKKAVTDYMVGNGGQFVNSDGSIKGEMLRTFLRKNDGALGQLFTGDEMTALGNVSRDIARSNLSVTGTKIPGGSDTAQNATAIGKFLGTTLGKSVAEGALHGSGLAALFYHGGWPLVIGSILSAGRGATALGKAAINRTTASAMADPAYAGQILKRVSPPAMQNDLTTGWYPAAAGAAHNDLTGAPAR